MIIDDGGRTGMKERERESILTCFPVGLHGSKSNPDTIHKCKACGMSF
jgi:hypothetical protein